MSGKNKDDQIQSSEHLLNLCNRLLVVVIIALLGFVASMVLLPKNSGKIAPVKQSEDRQLDAMAKITKSQKPFELYEETLKKRNLFKPLNSAQASDTAALKKAMPALHKRIKLIGILMDNDSKAIVEDLQEKQTHFLSQGERVGTVLLERIEENKVTFDDNGKKIEMAL